MIIETQVIRKSNLKMSKRCQQTQRYKDDKEANEKMLRILSP
jgi:hypothetical protein